MFVSLLVTGESPTCTISDDLPTSVLFYYCGSDSGETVDVRMDSFAGETGTIDVVGSGLENIPCLGKSFTKSGQDLMVDLTECVSDVQISSATLFGPRRDLRHSDQVLHSRGYPAHQLIARLCRRGDAHTQGRTRRCERDGSK